MKTQLRCSPHQSSSNPANAVDGRPLLTVNEILQALLDDGIISKHELVCLSLETGALHVTEVRVVE